MKEEIIEYHPNGQVSHRIIYNSNGQKWYEQFYDQKGYDHRESGTPNYRCWYDNGDISYITHYVHGRAHNIYNPGKISFYLNGKICYIHYVLNDSNMSKIDWLNYIKNI